MSDCERFEPAFEGYVAGALDESAIAPLLAHARVCKDCRQVLELHRDLAGLASRAPEPEPEDLASLRAGVLGRLAATPGAIAPHPRTVRLPRVAAALAASVLLFVAGLFAGRAAWSRTGANGEAALSSRLIGAIRADAASNRDLTDVEDSPFTYSNVSFRSADGDRVALEFDVTRHVQVVEPARSELVRDVLAQSLLNPSNPGASLRAMALAAKGELEPKLEEALLFALRRDPSLAVRLEALTIVAGRIHDPQVQAAVLATLRDDDSVQLRLLALDALAAGSFDRGRIRETIREHGRPGDEALLVRLAEHEKRL